MEIRPSSLEMSDAVRDGIAATWEQAVKDHEAKSAERTSKGEPPLNPIFNAPKFRFEGAEASDGKLRIHVSKTDYCSHNILRHQAVADGEYLDTPAGKLFREIGRTDELAAAERIMPATMYAVTIVECAGFQYLLGGCWNQDQADQVATVPCGFYEPKELEIGSGTQTYQEHIAGKYAAQLSLSDDPETNLARQARAVNALEARAIITGENRDTTTVFVTTVSVNHLDDVKLLGTKYRGDQASRVFIPCAIDSLREITSTGMFNGRKVNDLFVHACGIVMNALIEQEHPDR